MNDYDKKQLHKALDLLTEAMTVVRTLAGEINTSVRSIYEIEKTTSRSNNITWRAQCEDGQRLYFRMADIELYKRDEIWDKLDNLDMDSVYAVKIEVETIPDGDFHKIIKINKWEDIPTEPAPF